MSQLSNSSSHNWIKLYILWELSLIKELGYGINLPDVKDSLNTVNYSITINNKKYLFRIEGSASFELGDEIEITINISRASIFDKMSEERI